MELDLNQFIAATGIKKPVIAETWFAPMSNAMARWEIEDPEHVAAFLAQVSHECGHFTVFSENLNYRAERLMAVWPKRFPTMASALPYANNPEKLANKVYANRFGNGPESSGDGWRFRGRGPIQITFRDNYSYYAQDAGASEILSNPDLLLHPQYGADSAAWFWHSRGCGAYVDRGDFNALTISINGGTNGLAQREQLWAQARSALNIG